MSKSKNFYVPPKNVLDGALAMNPAAVTVVCRSRNGRVVVFSSEDGGTAKRMLERGRARIDELTVITEDA